MLKKHLATLTLGLLLFAGASLHAQMRPIKDAVFTGSISTPPSTFTGKIVETPITKGNLLLLFGKTVVKPADTAFFLAADQNSIVLASKDGATVYVTITSPESEADDTVFVSGKAYAQVKSYVASSFFNKTFHGSYSLSGTRAITGKIQKQTVTLKIAASGTVGDSSTRNAVVSATFKGTVLAPQP